MKTFEDVFGPKHDLGPDYELREVTVWRVHCMHCGVINISDVPQTEKAFAAVQRVLAGQRRKCRNPNCVSNGGTERRRQ